jgi:hypothetical protein
MRLAEGQLYPIGTPVPVHCDLTTLHGKVVGYGQRHRDNGVVESHYMVELDEPIYTEDACITVVTVHPDNIDGLVKCSCCETLFTLDDGILDYSEYSGEYYWVSRDCAK